MNSSSPMLDLPEMAAVPIPPSLPLLELLVSTSAGKPLLHFAYGHDRQSGVINTVNTSVAPAPHRPPLAISSLAAASTAFQHATSSRPREVITPHGVLISLVADPFHVHVSSQGRHTPPVFLRGLARVALSTLYFSLSAAFPRFLASRPNADVSYALAPARKLVAAALLDALTYPLPHLLLASVPLPCPTSPSSRAAIADVLRRALLKWRDVLTHAAIFTASPPFPRRVVATAAPANRELSPTDLLLLMNLAPLRLDDEVLLPERVYLQADDFSKASWVALRSVHLRLDPDDYERFKSAVGGAQWRPEWNAAGGDMVWIVGIVRKAAGREKVSEEFLDFVEDALDRKSATRDLMVCMERPWTLDDMTLSIEPEVKACVKAVLLIERDKFIGTVGSFSHAVGVAVMQTLVRWDRVDMSVQSPLLLRSKNSLVARFPACNILVVMWHRKFVVCFDGNADVDDAVTATEKAIVPWMKRFRCSIVPEHDRATVPPQTPLAGILSPFHS